MLLLVNRLERISADSRLAHRASGIRGSMLSALDKIDLEELSPQQIEKLLNLGFDLLYEAANQVSGIDDHRWNN